MFVDSLNDNMGPPLGGAPFNLKTKNHVRSQHILNTPYIQFFFFVKSRNFSTSNSMHGLEKFTCIYSHKVYKYTFE